MARAAGVARDRKGLVEALAAVEEMSEAGAGASPLLAARLILEGALGREESRGAHYRLDFPEASPTAQRTFMTYADDVVRAALPPFNAAPAARRVGG
jgi:L-aspartate oxidase